MKLPDLLCTPVAKRNEWELWVNFVLCSRYDWYASNCSCPTSVRDEPESRQHPPKLLCLAVVSVVMRIDVVCVLLFR